MGGNIAVTIREQDGTEHRMCRWTNAMPGFLTNVRLAHKNSEYVGEITKTWYDFVKDYALHKEDEQFEHPMTSSYAPYPFLAPESYGLIVVDMMTDQILECNGYSTVGNIDIAAIRNHMSEDAEGDFHMITLGGSRSERRPKKGMNAFYEEDIYGPARRFKDFADEKRVVSVVGIEGKIDVHEKSFVELLPLIMQDKDSFFQFTLDMSPFTIKKYGEGSAKEARRMRKDVEELGFVLSKEEKQIWREWR